MSFFPYINDVAKLFLAHERETSASATFPSTIALFLHTSSSQGAGQFRLTPEFQAREALEAFCERSWSQVFQLADELREGGVMPELFWHPSNG